MAGSISSLGIGSSVLTSDVIDQLRDVDESAIITPIDRKLETNTTQQSDLSALTILVSTLKSSASSLSNYSLYHQRNVSTNGDSATLTASAGVSVQDLSIDVQQLAQKDIYQSNTFSDDSSTFASADDTLTLTIGGKDYTFDVTSSTTLSELATEISNNSDDKIQARVMNVGGDNPYRLIIQSANTGEDNAITFGGASILTDLGLDDASINAVDGNRLSSAQDAKFTYNNILIQRDSNEISDITTGVTIKLLETGSTTFGITQDTSKITEEIESFVNAYNDLINNLSTATDYDSETGNSGTFQGTSEITSIERSINRLLLGADNDGRSLVDYGLELNESGLLTFESSTLAAKLSSDPTDVESFFLGMTTYDTTLYSSSAVSSGALDFSLTDLTINGKNIEFTTLAGATAEENAQALRDAINSANISGILASLNSNNTGIVLTRTDGGDITIGGDDAKLTSLGLTNTTIAGTSETTEGVFVGLNDLLASLIDSNNGTLTLLDQKLATERTRLTDERSSSMDKLDNKYEIMAARFAAYDAQIAALNNQFSTLQSMIEAEYNSDN